MNASSTARYAQFTSGDLRIYFTERTTNTKIFYVPVVLLTGGASLTMGSAVTVTTITSPLVSGIRRGSNGNIYYTTNTTAVPNTLNIHMISTTEGAFTVGGPNAIASIITNGSLPLVPHIIDYSSPITIPPVLARTYKQKVYELKDHLSNVHSTVYDYKIPLSDPGNLILDKRFDNATTENFVVGTGSPAGTTVTNLENRMRVFGTLNSAAHLNMTSITLPANNTYLISFDYVAGTASMASYSLYTTGAPVNLTGTLTVGGRYNIPVKLPSGVTATDIKFICQDAAANKTFFIDNFLIKKITSTINDPVVVLDHTGITPSGWSGTNGTVAYATGNIQLSNGSSVTNASISKTFALTPGLVYKISFNLTASVGGFTPRVDLKYTNNGGTQTDYRGFIRSTSGGPTSYEYYIVPESGSGTLSFTYENGTAQPYALTINNLIITQYQNQSKALYAASVQSMQDYYAFGMIMPGKNASTPAYRYGFQGQEKDDEIKGSGNSLNYEYRMHDTRLGRFFAVDPLASKYPYNSPYAFSENRVIDGLELEGLEWVSFNGDYAVNISKMTDDEVAELFAKNNANFDSDWLDSDAKNEYWEVKTFKNEWNWSTGTRIEKYLSKSSRYDSKKDNPVPYFVEWDRTLLEYITAQECKFDKPGGWWDGMWFGANAVALIFSGGTSLAAKGITGRMIAAGSFLYEIDELMAMPDEETILGTIIEKVGGKTFLDIYKGFKFYIDIKKGTKALIEVGIDIGDGKIVKGLWDANNSVFVKGKDIIGAVKSVYDKHKEMEDNKKKNKEKEKKTAKSKGK
jgi:RHS repeat-associated protein